MTYSSTAGTHPVVRLRFSANRRRGCLRSCLHRRAAGGRPPDGCVRSATPHIRSVRALFAFALTFASGAALAQPGAPPPPPPETGDVMGQAPRRDLDLAEQIAR